MYIIYKLVCSISNKAYIGLTSDLARRLESHQKPQSNCRYLKYAIAKYGWDSFSVEVLIEVPTLEEANALEFDLIYSHKTLAPEGYNLRSGGNVGILSEETKRKMKQAAAERPPCSESTKQKLRDSFSSRNTEEYREECRQKRLGKSISTEARAKISLSKKGKPGRPQSESERTARSQSMIGIPRPQKTCFVCGMVASTTNILRWHDAKCKKL